jgi:hypothetical protein
MSVCPSIHPPTYLPTYLPTYRPGCLPILIVILASWGAVRLSPLSMLATISPIVPTPQINLTLPDLGSNPVHHPGRRPELCHGHLCVSLLSLFLSVYLSVYLSVPLSVHVRVNASLSLYRCFHFDVFLRLCPSAFIPASCCFPSTTLSAIWWPVTPLRFAVRHFRLVRLSGSLVRYRLLAANGQGRNALVPARDERWST